MADQIDVAIIGAGPAGCGRARPLEAHADTIFSQAENRLHAQKAILSMLARPLSAGA